MTITPYKGNITVQAGSLFFEQWNPSDRSSDYFTNKVPITFRNGNATINFETQMQVAPNGKTTVVLDNTQGTCTVSVYDDYQRKEVNKIAQIPAGRSSEAIEYAPGASVPFYFSYIIGLKGIDEFTLDYVPQIGKDQVWVRVDAGKTNSVIVPKLDKTVSSDELLSNKSFLLIQNNSFYPFQLLRGTGLINPDDSSAPRVNSGERAQYTVDPAEASAYKLLVGADEVPFPVARFEAGQVYSFLFEDAVSLIRQVEIKLENVSGATPLAGVIMISPSANVTVGTALTAVYSGTETVNYQWKKEGVNVGANSKTFTPSAEGSYTVTVSASGYNSKTSAAVTVTGGDVTTTFTSIEAFDLWLSAQPANTGTTPYRVKLNVNRLGGDSGTDGSVGNVLSLNRNKYVYLDLSGSTMTAISDNAFRGCTRLTSVTISNSVTGIGDSAFEGCTSLTSVTIPNSVNGIGEAAFNGCTSLTSITIPNGVTSIKYYAFRYCSSLTSVIIPNSVTSIRAYAFQGCTSLTSVTIPNSVTSIGNYAFSSCTSLTAITVDTGNANYSSDQGVLYNKEKTSLVAYPAGKSGAFTIPNSVTSIGHGAFRECASLTSVTIPDSVTSIGDGAFENCTSLTSVTIPNSVTSIGGWTFKGCTSLTSVTIGNSVTSIEWYAFAGCTSLTSINIPNNVTSIGSRAFGSCTSLTSVIFEGADISISIDHYSSPFDGDLDAKYRAGGAGTYKTTAPVDWNSVWTKQ